MEANVYFLDSSLINRNVMDSEPIYDVNNVATMEQSIGEYVELVQVNELDFAPNQTDMCYSDKRVMYIPWCEDGKVVLKPLRDNSNGFEIASNQVNVTSVKLVKISDTDNYVITNDKNESPELVDVISENPVLPFHNNNNKVDLSQTIYNKRNAPEPATSLETPTPKHNNSENKKNTLPGYVHDAYRIHQDTTVNSGTRYAQERYMLYSGCKSKLKNGLPIRTESLKMIPPKQFKLQLMDTNDIVTPLTLSPRTKKLVAISELNYDKCLFNPIRCVPRCLRDNFSRNCITSQENNDIDVKELELQPLGFTRVIDYSKIKRITRKRKNRTPFEQIYIADSNENDASTTIVPNSKLQLTTHTGLIDNNLEVLISGNDEGNFFYEGETTGKEQIIVIHDGRETAASTAYTQKNIEVLLAAAAEEDSVSFCHQQGQVVSVETENDTLISDIDQQIIIVGNAFHNND